MKPTIVLIRAAFSQDATNLIPRHLPLSLLSLAPMLDQRFKVEILDRAVDADDAKLAEVLGRPEVLLCGVSTHTGPGIVDALHCSRTARRCNPKAKVVWGGWQSTTAPQSVLEQDCVDFIVQGEGELALKALVEALATGGNWREIAGLGFKGEQGMVVNPPARIKDLDSLPPPAYHLIKDLRRYIIPNWLEGAVRCLPMETSRGCPHGCSFCEVGTHFRNHYGYKSPQRILEEIGELKSLFAIDGVRFFDPNFFVRINRAQEFAQGMLQRGWDIKWAADGSIIQFRKIPLETLRLFRDSGMRFVSFGIESGSDQVRDSILNKPFTNEECFAVFERFRELGINFKFNIMIGLPGEKPADTLASLDFTLRILREFPNASLGGHMYSYMPFPSTPLTGQALKAGWTPPHDLLDYASTDYFGKSEMAWLDPAHQKMVKSLSSMSFFLSANPKNLPYTGLRRTIFRVLRAWFAFRLRRHWLRETPDVRLLANKLF